MQTTAVGRRSVRTFVLTEPVPHQLQARNHLRPYGPVDSSVPMDTGKVPEQFAVILILERPGDLGLPVAGSWQSLRRGMFAGGGLHPQRATSCSLVQRTGPRRRMAVLKLDRARMAAAAHRGGATTNDAVLVAVAAALHQILLGRGEFVDSIVITVPVSGRRPGGGQGWAISLVRCSSMSRPAAVWPSVSRG
jgi:hypothetical protein